MKSISANLPFRVYFKKPSLPVSLRTDRDELQYAVAKSIKGATKPFLEEERLKEWKHWILIENRFPYSAVFKVHHLLVPKRIVGGDELNQKEIKELFLITRELEEKYDCQLINFKSKQSIVNHFHIHLLTYKDRRKEVRL